MQPSLVFFLWLRGKLFGTKKVAINVAIRAITFAITQGIPGFNPIITSVGFCAHDAFCLIFVSDKLSQNEKDKMVFLKAENQLMPICF